MTEEMRNAIVDACKKFRFDGLQYGSGSLNLRNSATGQTRLLANIRDNVIAVGNVSIPYGVNNVSDVYECACQFIQTV